jgi:hypothetical protein
MNPGGRGLRRAPGDEMASCKGRGSKTVCKALLCSADGGRAVALATAAATGATPALMQEVFGCRNRLNRPAFWPPRRPAQGRAVGSTGVLILAA